MGPEPRRHAVELAIELIVQRNIEFLPDEAGALECQRAGAFFPRIVGVLLDPDRLGKSLLRLESERQAQRPQPRPHDFLRVNHAGEATMPRRNCRFAVCEPLTSSHGANYSAPHGYARFNHRRARRHYAGSRGAAALQIHRERLARARWWDSGPALGTARPAR